MSLTTQDQGQTKDKSFAHVVDSCKILQMSRLVIIPIDTFTFNQMTGKCNFTSPIDHRSPLGQCPLQIAAEYYHF